MPELPEVETVVRDLRPLVVGRSIAGVRRSQQNLRRPWNPDWDTPVTGCRVEAIRRRGKWILVDLRSRDAERSAGAVRAPLRVPAKQVLLVHLGMTGQFTAVPAAEPEPDHLHLVFALSDDTELRFRDVRRFGSVEFAESRREAEDALDAELGPEPFDLDPAAFRESVTGTARILKAILLDQTVVAGVGNIYADESLFRAKLHPARTGKSLTAAECDRLREAIEAVLTRAIESRGSTIRDYVGGSGLRGGFQTEFAVYGRTGEPCGACGTAVECLRLAGRSSHFCPVCQKRKTHHKGTKITQRATKRTLN